MPSKNSKIHRVIATFVIASALLAFTPADTLASPGGDPLTSAQEVPEMMMELQGSLFGYLATDFGESGGPISFTTAHDVSVKTFSFTSSPSSTYGGQTAVINGSGTFNTSLSRWDFLVSGTVLGQPIGFTGMGVDPPMHFDLDFAPQNRTIDTSVDLHLGPDTVISAGFTQIRDFQTNQLISSYIYADYYKFAPPDMGSWFWSTNIFPTLGGSRKVSSNGFAPAAGGAGSFTVSVAVPEPASLGLLAAGGLMTLRRRRRIA